MASTGGEQCAGCKARTREAQTTHPCPESWGILKNAQEEDADEEIKGASAQGTAVTLSLAAGTVGSALGRACAREETMSAGRCSRDPDALRGARSPQPSRRDSSSSRSHRAHRQDTPLGQHAGCPLLLASPRETSLVPKAWGPNLPLDAEGQDEPAVRSPWGSMWAPGKLPSCPAPLGPGGQEGLPLPGMLSSAPSGSERGGCLTGRHRQGLTMNLISG